MSRSTHLELLQKKIVLRSELPSLLSTWRLKDDVIVFTNGCFDLIHRGHIDYLCKAADLGNRLVVGVNTDASVRRLGKGNSRPLQDEQTRAMIMASFSFVSAVVLFDEDTPQELIAVVQPDVLVKGADYKPEQVVGRDIVLARGGRVELIEYLEGFSTTGIEKKIIENSGH